MHYVLQKEDGKKSKLEELLNSQLNQNLSTPIITVGKNIANNISSFCTGTKIYIAYDNGFKICKIELLNGIIKAIHDKRIGNMIQQFNIRTSYVATIEKQLVSGIANFYHQIRSVQNNNQNISQTPNEQTLFFDTSHETNLQRALTTGHAQTNTVPNTANAIQELPTTPVETSSITANQEQRYNEILNFNLNNEQTANTAITSEENKSKVKTLAHQKSGFRKLAGYINIVMLGTIVAALLIFASILIGVKIINMS